MIIKSGRAAGLIAVLVLFAGFAFAEGQQQNDPGMQSGTQSGSQSQQGAMMQDPDTVKQVQQALSNQGYDAGPADGKMGAKTKSALKKFQESKGMQASGKLDQQTLASLGVSGSAAGGTQDEEQKQESSGAGAGGQVDEMQKEEQQGGAGGQQGDMQSQPSDAQSGGR